jgi:hypothetical protein
MSENKSFSTREVIAVTISGAIILVSAVYWILQIADALKLIIQNGAA